MRKMFYALVVLCLMVSGAWADVEINATNFSDDTFREYVSSNFDTDSNDVLSDAEIAGATSISINNRGISSLKGIEYFTALTELYCENNQLTELDVSNNTALEHLNCGGNQLTALDLSNNTALTWLGCYINQLTELDLSNNTALTNLGCYINKLTELNLSNNTALKDLECVSNPLIELDLSNCTALTTLNCSYNQLSTLDVSNNTDLTELDCYENKLTALDVSNNTALTNLNCGYNQLTMLYVSKNTALTTLYCGSNKLTELDVSKNTTLTTLDCRYNQLATLNLSNSTALWRPNCNSQDISPLNITSTGNSSYPYQLALTDYMSSDQTANVSSVQGYDSSNAEITTSYADGDSIALFAASPAKVTYNYNTGYNSQTMDVTISDTNTETSSVEISSTNFPDDTFRQYVSDNFDTDSDGVLTDTEIADTTVIGVADMGISSLKGIEYFTALTELWADNNNLTSLDISKCTALKKIGLHENSLVSLDVSTATLTELHCGDNQLTSLVLGNQPELTQLYCYRNQLTALDVSKCPALEQLHFGGNSLTTIDLSNCPALELLHCWNNQLCALDLSANTALSDLICPGQSRDNSVITSSGNASYPYQLALTDYMTITQAANVSDVQGYLSNGKNIAATYSADTGIAMFALIPAKITYNYNTGYNSATMDVTISGDIPATTIEITSTNFPDEAFRLCVTSNFDTDGDSVLSYAEIESATSIYVGGQEISSLKGLEYFTALTYLDCYNNQLASLDVSGNTALTYLNCDNNQLTSLDVSSCTALTYLYCSQNQLTSLDVSNNTALKELYCYENQLTELDVSSNTALTTLYCHSNQLATLDLANNTDLTTLSCAQTREGLNITSTGDSSYPYQLDFSAYMSPDKFANVSSVQGYDSGNDSINTSYDNGLALFEALPATVIYDYATGYGSNLMNVTLTADSSSGAVEANSTNFPDEAFRSYVISEFDTDGDGALSYSEIGTVATMNVAGKGITSLSGLEYFTALTHLYCYSNDLTVLDLGNNTALTILHCWSNDLTTLDVSNNAALTELCCEYNQLTSLDVSNNTALTRLHCYHNQLAALDVSKNTDLTYLYCEDNQLKELDVSNNTALTHLFCSRNQLTMLDVSNNTALQRLSLESNNLTALDVSNNTELIVIWCYGNQLTELDVSNNTALINLSCGNNNLTALDVSNNTALNWLYCYNNQLTALDVGNNVALTTLRCYNNQLATLDLTNNSALTSLDCYSQDISPVSIAISGNTSYPYQLNFTSYMTSAQTANVSGVRGYDSSSADIDTTYSDGIAQFAANPAKVTYYYSTGYNSNSMDVTISGSSDDDPDNSSVRVAISEANFPDSAFMSYITRYLDLDEDGVLSYADIAGATSISVNSRGISSLKGLEYFTALTSLECSYNDLTELDLSKNTALTELYCDHNNLTTLDLSNNTALTYLYCVSNDLTELDLSKNSDLTYLYADSNKLASLDVSGCPSLIYLHCDHNELTELDVSNNPALKELYCCDNQLAELDVSNNTAIENLDCDTNHLAVLDLSKNTVISYLRCAQTIEGRIIITNSGNPSQPYQMDFSAYMSPDKFANVSDVKGIDSNDEDITATYSNGIALFGALPATVTYNYATGYESELMNVTISGDVDILTDPAVTDSRVRSLISRGYVSSNGQRLSPSAFRGGTPPEISDSATSATISLNFDVQSWYLYINGSQVESSGLTASRITASRFLTAAAEGSIAQNDSSSAYVTVDSSQINSGTTASVEFGVIPSDSNITEPIRYTLGSVTGTGGTSSGVGVADINSDNFPDETFRNYVSENFDTNNDGILSESEIANATEISVSARGISSLRGVERFTALISLDFGGNQCTEIDISRNTALKYINCYGNRLTALDVTHNTALVHLDASNNQLTTLDVSQNSALSVLYCAWNNLTAINLASNEALTRLALDGNQLTRIDVSNNPALEYLNLNSNSLTALDLTRNTALRTLDCGNNSLRTLDLPADLQIAMLNLDNQLVQALNIVSTDNGAYPYMIDLRDYVSADKLGKIYAATGYDASGSEIETVYENGIARFASRPDRMVYTYDTGTANPLNVTVGQNSNNGNGGNVIPIEPFTPPSSRSQATASVSYNGHEYALYDLNMTWDEARSYCESLGGNLATITSQAEQNAVEGLLRSGSGSAYWLGGERNSDSWRWVTNEAFSYNNWDDGQPGDSGSCMQIYGSNSYGIGEDNMSYSTTGRWSSASSGEQQGFICEFGQVALEVAVVAPVSEDLTMSRDFIARLAQTVSIEPHMVNFLRPEHISPYETPDPTKSMKETVSETNGHFVAKLSTIRVDKEGWYAFVVTVSDDLIGMPVSEMRLYSAENSDFRAGEFAASFGLMPVVNGITGGLEITNLFGVKLDTLPKQFIAMMMLSSGKSLSVYLVKILILLATGCSAGAGVIALLAVAFFVRRNKRRTQ